MEQIGNFLKVGDERILIGRLVRYRRRVEHWMKGTGEETPSVPMVTYSVDVFHDMGNGIVNQDTLWFTQQRDAEPAQAQIDCDALLAELDTFFTGYKAKEGYGEPKPE